MSGGDRRSADLQVQSGRIYLKDLMSAVSGSSIHT